MRNALPANACEKLEKLNKLFENSQTLLNQYPEAIPHTTWISSRAARLKENPATTARYTQSLETRQTAQKKKQNSPTKPLDFNFAQMHFEYSESEMQHCSEVISSRPKFKALQALETYKKQRAKDDREYQSSTSKIWGKLTRDSSQNAYSKTSKLAAANYLISKLSTQNSDDHLQTTPTLLKAMKQGNLGKLITKHSCLQPFLSAAL